MHILRLLIVTLCAAPLVAQELTPQAILDHTRAATVLVLAGQGSGRLESIGSGVLITKDGTILTAYHVVKGAQEVQVRLPNGDAFDRVELLGVDERRDIAALKISGGGLPFLKSAESGTLKQGDPIYAVTNADALNWSATQGIVSAVRPADELPGAGSGYRLIQFTAPVAPGASGGPLVNGAGDLVGIITLGKGNAAFAVPVESVTGLPEAGPRRVLGSGAQLHMPVRNAEASSGASVADTNPQQLLKKARTVFIMSKTSFLTVDTLDRALLLQKNWPALEMRIVQDQRLADLKIEIDRPLFTYVHTFVMVDEKTSVVLGSGKVTAFDGTIASGPLAKDIVKILADAKLGPEPKK